MIEPKAEFTMKLVKTYTVEGMELLDQIMVEVVDLAEEVE